ncbi:ATP-binding protein, partial [Pyxidicoccus sp. 3LG]
ASPGASSGFLTPGEGYPREGGWTADAVLRGWLAHEEQALARGYAGLRMSGNTSWLKREDWGDFREYERRADALLSSHRIIALCGYCLEHCTQEGVLDVVRHHGFALVRNAGEWECLEGSTSREARKSLRQLTGELERRVAERTAELEAALRVRDEFLSVASHELKTPLASLRLSVDGLVHATERDAPSPGELPRKLARIQDQCRRLDRLIVTMLDVSQLSTHRPVLDLEQVDLGALVRTTAERHEQELQHSGCDLCIRAPRGIVGCWDRLRVEQVFTNLLTNALRHAAGAPIEITISAREGVAVLAVRDSGPGISREDQQRLFQRYSRLEAGRPRGGFGLGLWISRQLVELHGGSLSVESAPGQGATFTVCLPLPDPPDA